MKKQITLTLLLTTLTLLGFGQTLLKDIIPGTTGSFPNSLFELDGKSYFFAYPDADYESQSLYRIDNNTATLVTQTTQNTISEIYPENDKIIYYKADYANASGQNKNALFVFDGTTSQEIVIDPIDSSSFIADLYYLDNKTYVLAGNVQGSNGTTLFEISGTNAVSTGVQLGGAEQYRDTLHLIQGTKGSTKGDLYYIDISTNQRTKKTFSPALDFRVLLGEFGGDFYALVDGATSSELWTINDTPKKLGNVGALNSFVLPKAFGSRNKLFFRSKSNAIDWAIYMYDADEGTIVNVTKPQQTQELHNDNGNEQSFAYVPGEEKVYFIGSQSRSLYVYDIATDAVSTAFGGEVNFPLTVTSNLKMVFASPSGTNFGHYLYELKDGALKRLTDSTKNRWSSISILGSEIDGTKIYFESIDTKATPSTGLEVYYIDLNESTGSIGRTTKQINTYPNPVQGKLTIDLPVVKSASVHTITGQEILNISNQKTINTMSLTPGVYLLKAYDGKQTYTSRFIKN